LATRESAVVLRSRNRGWSSLALVGCLCLSASAVGGQTAAHPSHRGGAPAELGEVARRPIRVRHDVGKAHDPVATNSGDAQAFYDQGLALLHSYWWLDAARSFNQALAADPRLAVGHAMLSIAYTELGAPQAARDAIGQARSLGANASDHDRRHIELRAMQMDAESAGAWRLPDLQAYRRAVDAALATYPRDEELLLLRGLAESSDPAERGQGSGAASIPFFDRARTLAPDHIAPHHYLTHAYENSGRIADALTEGSTYAKMAPGVPHARHMYGHNLRRTGRIDEAIVEFAAADALETRYFEAERIGPEFDWHYQHNLDLLATSYQYAGQMRRAEPLLKRSFAIPSKLVTQEFNKREWPVFLIARGRAGEALAAARVMAAHPFPLVSAAGHVMAGLAQLALGGFKAAADEANAALGLMRGSPNGAGLVANPLQQLQGEFFLRTGDREKGRQTLRDLVGKLRAAPGPDAWAQALFTLEAIARTAREIGDWDLAAWTAGQMIEHDAAYGGSHYAMAVAARHAGDASKASTELELARRCWKQADPDVQALMTP
jgi:tetratricopeptide (TPR) repeat protein